MKVRKINKKALDQALKHYVVKISQKHPEVLSIVLYGSFSKGNFSPGSDVDLLFILEKSKQRILDRIPSFLDPYLPFSLDILPYTVQELKQIFRAHPRFKREILTRGKILSGEKEFERMIRE